MRLAMNPAVDFLESVVVLFIYLFWKEKVLERRNKTIKNLIVEGCDLFIYLVTHKFLKIRIKVLHYIIQNYYN